MCVRVCQDDNNDVKNKNDKVKVGFGAVLMVNSSMMLLGWVYYYDYFTPHTYQYY